MIAGMCYKVNIFLVAEYRLWLELLEELIGYDS
jgi:hypothetical protein